MYIHCRIDIKILGGENNEQDFVDAFGGQKRSSCLELYESLFEVQSFNQFWTIYNTV